MAKKLNVVINGFAEQKPEDSNDLITQGMGLLNFLVSLGYDSQQLPVASLLSKSAHLEGHWLVISPVHWQATHNDAMIMAVGEELGLTDMQAQALHQRYATYLAEEGLTLYYFQKDLWLLRCDNLPTLSAKPVYQLLNKSLMPELSSLDSTLFWQKFITESQMFFASFDNETAVNGVWVWGGSATTSLQTTSAICVDESLFALAQNCTTRVTKYSPELSLNDFDLFFLNSLNSLSVQHQEELNKIPANWYWNNIAYTRCNPHWIARLWRKMIHAD